MHLHSHYAAQALEIHQTLLKVQKKLQITTYYNSNNVYGHAFFIRQNNGYLKGTFIHFLLVIAHTVLQKWAHLPEKKR